jgi:hypothetical protein
MYNRANSQASVQLPSEESRSNLLDQAIAERELHEWINCVIVPALVNKYLREELFKNDEHQR